MTAWGCREVARELLSAFGSGRRWGTGEAAIRHKTAVFCPKVLPSRKRYCRKLNSPCLAASPVPPAACTTHFVHQFLHLVVVWATTWSTPLERLQLFSEFMVCILNNCSRLAAHYRASYYISQPLVRAANKHSIIVAVVDRVQPRQVRRGYAVRCGTDRRRHIGAPFSRYRAGIQSRARKCVGSPSVT